MSPKKKCLTSGKHFLLAGRFCSNFARSMTDKILLSEAASLVLWDFYQRPLPVFSYLLHVCKKFNELHMIYLKNLNIKKYILLSPIIFSRNGCTIPVPHIDQFSKCLPPTHYRVLSIASRRHIQRTMQ